MTDDSMNVQIVAGGERRQIADAMWVEVTFGDCVLRLWAAKNAPGQLGLYVYAPDILRRVVGVDDYWKNLNEQGDKAP